MAQLTDEAWALLKNDWRNGVSVAELSRRFGVSTTTIHRKKSGEDWSLDPADEASADDVQTADDDPNEEYVERIAALERDLAEARAREAEAVAEARANAPRADIRHLLPETAEQALEYDEQGIRELAYRKLERENTRLRRIPGSTLVDITEAKVEAEMRRLAEARAGWWRKGKPANPRYRYVKMLKKPTDRHLAQIPAEKQINNMAGSIHDAIQRYKEKGFKFTDPLLCCARDCFDVAMRSGDSLTYKGYCSEAHMRSVEGGHQAQTISSDRLMASMQR